MAARSPGSGLGLAWCGCALAALLLGCSASRTRGPGEGEGEGEGAAPDLGAADAGADGGGRADLEPGDTSPAPPDLRPDSGGDAPDGGDDLGPDGGEGPDGGTSVRCRVPEELLERTFELLPDAPDTQIHATLAVAGDRIWLAYNLPEADGTGGFDVWLAALDCAGQLAVAPRLAHTGDPGNDVDPALAVGRDSLLVAWSSDAGGDPNLLLYTRAFSRHGDPLGDAERLLTPGYDGAPLLGNALAPRLAALADGSFLLAALWGVPAAARFQMLVQRLDAAGQPPEATPGAPAEAILARLEPGVDQDGPAVAVLPDGTAHLAWARSTTTEGPQVVHTRLAADARSTDPAPVTALPSTASSTPSLTVAPDMIEEPYVYLAFQREGAEQDILLQDASLLMPEAPYKAFGLRGKADVAPAVAAAPGGGLLAWYRIRSGFRSDLLVRGFAYDGYTFTATGPERVLNPAEEEDEHAAAPYGIALAHLGEGVYLVIWSEGTSPRFRLRARFVRG